MAEHKGPLLILASASPRRRQLLAEAGYSFEVRPADINEAAFAGRGVGPAEYAKRLALAKAQCVAEQFPNYVVIGADTIVDCDGEVIGKPSDAKGAEEIVRKLFSTVHKVITAVALVRLSDGTQIVECDSTTVYPKEMSDEQIAEHIEKGNWQGKSGAYAIAEDGDRFVERIEGSLTNVMGLPMELLKRLLGSILKIKN